MHEIANIFGLICIKWIFNAPTVTTYTEGYFVALYEREGEAVVSQPVSLLHENKSPAAPHTR